jgi:hypothetical protein
MIHWWIRMIYSRLWTLLTSRRTIQFANTSPFLWKSLHPKPPNHVIVQESWKESIISIAAFTELPLNEQKREAIKESNALL